MQHRCASAGCDGRQQGWEGEADEGGRGRVFANLVMFFLMLNFLLAIVVEGYTKVRQDIDTNMVENEFFYDILLSLSAQLLGVVGDPVASRCEARDQNAGTDSGDGGAQIYRWPHRLEWVQMLQEDLRFCGKVVSFEDIWQHYLWQEEHEAAKQAAKQRAKRLNKSPRSSNPNLVPSQPPTPKVMTPGDEEASKESDERAEEKRLLRQRLRSMYNHYRQYDNIKCKPMFLSLKQNILGSFLDYKLHDLFKPTETADRQQPLKWQSDKAGHYWMRVQGTMHAGGFERSQSVANTAVRASQRFESERAAEVAELAEVAEVAVSVTDLPAK
eukprot:548606-Rhodomonas_salina.1